MIAVAKKVKGAVNDKDRGFDENGMAEFRGLAADHPSRDEDVSYRAIAAGDRSGDVVRERDDIRVVVMTEILPVHFA